MPTNSPRFDFPFILMTLLIGCSFFLGNCKNKDKDDKIPNALEDKSVDVSLLTKRSGKDLLENLYDDLEDKSEELQVLNNEMARLQKMTADSISLFTRYDNKSKTYYAAALQHVQSIQDSLLRLRMKKILDSSMNAYAALIAKDTLLIKSLDSSQVALQDMFTILKITKTLPLIQRYQKGYLPADSIYTNILNAYNETIRKTDSLARRP